MSNSFDKFWEKQDNKYYLDEYQCASDAWYAAKEEILKLVKNTKAPKVPGREGLGGCSWDDMDAETFREILIEKIKKL